MTRYILRIEVAVDATEAAMVQAMIDSPGFETRDEYLSAIIDDPKTGQTVLSLTGQDPEDFREVHLGTGPQIVEISIMKQEIEETVAEQDAA